jgi:hypothetical protein
MASERFVKDFYHTNRAAEAGSRVDEGDFVTLAGDGTLHSTDPSTDAVVDGIVPHRNMGQHLPEHEYDYTDAYYEAGAFPVPFYELEDGGKAMPFTVRDDAAPAPDIGLDNVVGVIMMDGSNYGSGYPVAVEEGYTADPDGDGTSTTYNRDNNNFLALGRADEKVTDHGEQVGVVLKSRMQASR